VKECVENFTLIKNISKLEYVSQVQTSPNKVFIELWLGLYMYLLIITFIYEYNKRYLIYIYIYIYIYMCMHDGLNVLYAHVHVIFLKINCFILIILSFLLNARP